MSVNKGKNSRWYSGSRIYRHVKLIVTDPLHIDQWGVHVATPVVSEQEAKVKVVTNVSNEKSERSDVKISTRLRDADNKNSWRIGSFFIDQCKR